MTPFDREVMARTMWGEARGEGREGIRAVGHVINNRMKSGKWYGGKTLAAVCLRGKQFSMWNDTDKNRLAVCELPDDDPTLNLCRSLCDDIVNGDEDPTFGATHYYSTSIPTPAWAISGQMTLHIGKHKFYRGIA